MIGSAGLSLNFAPAQRAALQALLGVGGGVLVGDLGDREPLQADREPRFVHHREHGVQATIFLGDQPAGCAIVVHHAGGVAVDAHLLFERAADHGVARAWRAVGLGDQLGHDEQRDAAGAFRRAFDARQHQMHDVLRQIVLAGGNENLGAGDLVAAISLLHRLGADHAEVGAAMRLGQIHGAGPFAGHHLRQIRRLLLRRAVHQDRGDRALGEAGIHREGQVGGRQELVDLLGHEHRQALAAEFTWARRCRPSRLRRSACRRP